MIPGERRELWEMLVDLLDSVGADDVLRAGLRVRSVDVDLPVEIIARRTEVGFRLLVDLPTWRWESGFALHFGRLYVNLEEGDFDELR